MFLDTNQRLYESRFMSARYATRSGLHADEDAILNRYGRDIEGGRILDIGVGGGRTTPYLTELSSNYVGVDYSPQMVEGCRRRFPDTQFQFADARDLSAFPESSFDFVLFSFNGIDAVGHDDRLKILKEVHRVLKPGALFAFSSHNREFPIPPPWKPELLVVNPLRSPTAFAKRLVGYPVGILNYARLAHRSEFADEYCVCVDSAYLYSMVHYRITAAAQEKQLSRAGFGGFEAFGMDGRLLCEGESTTDDAWVHYVCRRNRD